MTRRDIKQITGQDIKNKTKKNKKTQTERKQTMDRRLDKDSTYEELDRRKRTSCQSKKSLVSV